MDCDDVLSRLRSLADPKSRAGMARYGIATDRALGISMPVVRGLAREINAAYRKDLAARHDLAGQLWESGVHEARILAGLIDVPRLVDEAQMERWAADFDSWDVCDQVCSSLFDKTPFAIQKAEAWSGREAEFVKRAGFVLMACLAVHAKKLPDDAFAGFLPLIEREAADERNFVKKAVNWALRQIGKRNAHLNALAIERAERIRAINSRSARWIAADALRELRNKGF